MEDCKVLKKEFYNEYLDGVSLFSGNEVLILGEQTVQLEDGRIIEQYLYNIKGYACQNGKPFASLKANIGLI